MAIALPTIEYVYSNGVNGKTYLRTINNVMSVRQSLINAKVSLGDVVSLNIIDLDLFDDTFPKVTNFNCSWLSAININLSNSYFNSSKVKFSSLHILILPKCLYHPISNPLFIFKI